jgi:outer membrane protein OmpA-like peptidoglycan-associated protein
MAPDPNLSRAAQTLFVLLVLASACQPLSDAEEPVSPGTGRQEPKVETAATTAEPAASSAPSASNEAPPIESSSPPAMVAIYGMPCVRVETRVFFERNSSKIPSDATSTLDTLRELFVAYPSLVLEIRSHADKNERQKNVLAEQRAQSVQKALLERGVSKDAVPLVSCSDGTPLDKQGSDKNGRVEFVIRSGFPEGEVCPQPRPKECRDVGP